jgi:hypothetical protein
LRRSWLMMMLIASSLIVWGALEIQRSGISNLSRRLVPHQATLAV